MFQTILAVSAVMAASEPARATAYPRADLLVEGERLAARTGDFVILDARAKSRYAERHIAGARHVDHNEWAGGFGAGDDAAGWSKRIAALGIRADSRVVVYDDARGKDACRIWWLLRYWGVGQAGVLNGGWAEWAEGNRPTATRPPAVVASDFRAVPAHRHQVRKSQLLEALPQNRLQIVDARSFDEYCGVEKLKNRKAGSIPGAKHLDWTQLVDARGRFKPAAELNRLFADAGIDPARPTSVYCQSGGRASVMVFALELMGAPDVSNYYPSWGEWGNSDDTPVSVPPARK